MSVGTDRIERLRKKWGIGKERRIGLIGLPSLYCKAADSKNPRDIVVTANTDDIDLDQEVVIPDGADTRHYRANGANFLDHKYDFPHHVGFMRSLRMADGGRAWINRSQIFDNLKSPLADDLLTVAATAGIGSSIGYEELDGGPPNDKDPVRYQKADWVTRKWSMIELSFTAMPCNVACHGGAEAGMDAEKCWGILDNLVTKSRIKRETARALGLPDRELVAPGWDGGKRVLVMFEE